MESRKDQLQKQIIEALKAKDNDIYSLLRTQWAHRFGVESLEELKNIEEMFVTKTSNNEDNDKNDQLENNFSEVDKENQEKKSINSISQYKSPPKVEALIPLPPKPKYSFLRKWLFIS